MPYQIKLPVFEGPFDLLLNLISRHKVNIYDVPLAEITEEYIDYLDKMRRLDLDIASEFLLLAATLLEIKSAGLLPQPAVVAGDDVMTAFEQRQLLIGRLIEYRKFKNAGAALGARLSAEEHFYQRRAALEERFDSLLPDFLTDIDVRELGLIIVRILDRQRVRLIDSSHIANIKISVETKLEEVVARLKNEGRLLFRDIAVGSERAEVVALFLALLELYKRGLADIRQADTFGDIEIVRTRQN